MSSHRDACAYVRQGGKASSEGTSMYMNIPLRGGRFWSLNPLLEGKCLIYRSRSCSTGK